MKVRTGTTAEFQAGRSGDRTPGGRRPLGASDYAAIVSSYRRSFRRALDKGGSQVMKDVCRAMAEECTERANTCSDESDRQRWLNWAAKFGV